MKSKLAITLILSLILSISCSFFKKQNSTDKGEVLELIERYEKSLDKNTRLKLEDIGNKNIKYPFCRALYIASYDSYRFGMNKGSYDEPVSDKIKEEVINNREIFLRALNLRILEYALMIPESQFELYEFPGSIWNVLELLSFIPDKSSLKSLAAFIYTSQAVRKQSQAETLIQKIVDHDKTDFSYKAWWKKNKNVIFSIEELANFDEIRKKRSKLLRDAEK